MKEKIKNNYQRLMQKRFKRKQGVGGLLIILVTAILTFTVNTTMSLSLINNLKYLSNSALYFCGNKAAVSLYNTHSSSGSYTSVERVLRNNFDLTNEFKMLMKQAYPHLTDSNLSGTSVSIQWDKDRAKGIVKCNGFDTNHLGHITPNELEIIIEK